MSIDLEAVINQSLADKIVNSVNYPFVVFEHRKPYSGFSANDEEVDIFDDQIAIEPKEVIDEVIKTLGGIHQRRSTKTQVIENMSVQVAESIEELLENYNSCLSALEKVEEHNDSIKKGKVTENNKNIKKEIIDWDGPDKKNLKSMIKELENINNYSKVNHATLKKIIEFKAIVSWIRVAIGKRPDFKLSGKEFELLLPSILPSGTAELWAKYKWLKCVKRKFGICYKWKLITKSSKILSVTIKDIKFKFNGAANLKINGAIINVYANVKKLRLDYKFFDKIPLEKLANKKLSNSPVAIFDASKFIATVPILDSNFRISKVSIPDEKNKVTIKISVTNN